MKDASPARHSARLAVLSSLAVLVAGCSNAPYRSELVRDEVLFQAYGEEPKTFDPSISYNATEAAVTSLVSPGFFRYDFYKQKVFALQPNLGAAFPTVEKLQPKKKGDAAERWTYRLRHDLRFQDDPCFPGGKGRTITAADAVYAFKRMADPAVNSPVIAFVADKIVGWSEVVEGFKKSGAAQYDRPIPGIYVDPKDPYAFVIELNQPYPQLRFFMAMSFTSPQPREAIEKYGKSYGLQHVVGCGPYVFKEYVPSDHIYLERNPNAPKELFPTSTDPQFASVLAEAGKPVGKLKGIYLPILKEPVTTYNLFQQGYLDTLVVGATNAAMVPAANGLSNEMKARGVGLNRNVLIQTRYMAFNMDDPVFGGYTPKKRKLRQAISLSIDADSFINVVTQGMDVKSEWILPPGLPGFDPTYKNPYRQFDPKLTKAKRLLAEAGYPNGVDPETGQPLVLKYDNFAISPSAQLMVRLYKKQIEGLGIRVEILSSPRAAFDTRLRKRQAQFFDYGWVADYPDAENFVFLLYGPNGSPGPNYASYDNPEYNRLFEQMRAMPEGPERIAILEKMRDISVEDCPWIYISNAGSRTLVQPWVRNNYASPIAMDLLKYVAVDPEERGGLQVRWNRPVTWPIVGFVACLGLVVLPASATVRRRANRKVRRG